MLTLLHFPGSPYSRRARLCLLHKGLQVNLVDPRVAPHALAEVAERYPARTCPVLLFEDGRTLGDSMAISRYLDSAYPQSPLWPHAEEELQRALSVSNLVDATVEHINNLGQRYHPFRQDPAWPEVANEYLGRAQSCMGALAELCRRSTGNTVLESGWSAADIWLYSLVSWLTRMPTRVAAVPSLARTLALGWSLPPELSAWAEQHRTRADVQSLSQG